MAFESIATGDIQPGFPLSPELMQQIKDNFDALNGSIGVISSGILPNGSFEIDSDADGNPDSWVRYAQYPTGTHALDTAEPLHGGTALKITRSAGAGNGGEVWDSDYYYCSNAQLLRVKGIIKSSDAALHNKIETRYYDHEKIYLSAVTLYDHNTDNKTTAQALTYVTIPPAGACFAKLRLHAGINDNTTAGSVWFDGFSVDVATAGTSPPLDTAGYKTTTRDNVGWGDDDVFPLNRAWQPWFDGSRRAIVHYYFHADPVYQSQWRFRIGTVYSSVVTIAPDGYTSGFWEIDLDTLAMDEATAHTIGLQSNCAGSAAIANVTLLDF